jgi:hypothetical protein
VKTSNHAAAKAVYAIGGLAAVAVVCAAAILAAGALGAMAGYALIAGVFAACWIIFCVRPLLRPAPRPRASAPVMPSGNTSPEPARPDLLPVL